MANKTITQLDAAQSLNDNMVIAVQDTNTTYKTTLADVKAYCGGGSTDKYKVGDRVKDDSNNPVGTVSSIFTDGNGKRYAVVCLDAVNRLASGQWCSDNSLVTNMPEYDNGNNKWWYDNAKETATQNTQLILDYCSANNYSSSACSHCRSKSFTINGVTYYGQLPNMRELFDLWRHRVYLESMDITASSSSSLNLTAASSKLKWSSSQLNYLMAWYLDDGSGVNSYNKGNSWFVIPVLEIPLED